MGQSKRGISALGVVVLGAIAALISAPHTSFAQQAENSGPNESIARITTGKILYRTLSDGRERGTESFTLLTHTDGSRTLSMTNDVYATNSQLTAVLRVAESFRPIDSYVSYWVGGRFKGSGFFSVDGETLLGSVTGPLGNKSQELNVPDGFSFVTHPLAGDAWHFWYYDEAKGGPQDGQVFNIDNGPDPETPVLGQLQPVKLERIGEETITVPAGSFETIHYRLVGFADIWVSGPDNVLVRYAWEPFDREYVLVEYSFKDNAQVQ